MNRLCQFEFEARNEMSVSGGFSSLAPFDLHKQLINIYVLTRKGTTSLLRRDSSKDKRDIDVIRENHKFLWDDCDKPDTWEKLLAKKYYDKLFKEYCICDLSRFKENKVAMRWQTEQELVSGKGQFTCGEKCCNDTEGLRTWEVNFGYIEHGEKKNALVKLRLCPDCSYKLNYKSKKKEVKRKSKKRKSLLNESSTISKLSRINRSGDELEDRADNHTNQSITTNSTNNSEDKISEEEHNIWKEVNTSEERSRADNFEDYLEQLLL